MNHHKLRGVLRTEPPALCCGRFQTKALLLGGCLFLAATLLAARGSADMIVSCGFETTGDTWSYHPVGGSLNGDPGSADSPANQRIYSGLQSWLVKGTTSTLLFDEVLLSGWSDVAVKYRVSSTATNNGQGNTTDDQVTAYVATTAYSDQASPVFGGTADVTLTGWGGGATWGYNSGAPAQIKPVGWGGILRPTGDGPRTDDGFSNIAIEVPNGRRSLALKISITNDNQKKCWNLDTVTLEGTPTASNDRWWDGDGSGSVAGGSGAWTNTSATPWASDSNGSSHSAWNGANGDNARFTQSGGTVTIGQETTVAARSLTFTTDGYKIIAGDTRSRLVLTNGGSGGAGPNTIEIANSGDTATINVAIAGNPGVGLTKTGNGTLVLGGVNTYTGATAVNAGTVSISADYNLGGVGAGLSFNGGTLQLTASVDLQGNHPCAVLAGGGTIDTGDNTLTALTNGWSGAGALTKIGAGTLHLDGIGSEFSGAVAVRKGTLQLGSSQALVGCPMIDVSTGATLDATAIAGGYCLGVSGSQKLTGAGTILGDLRIAGDGVHSIGDSPGVQRVQGNYTMDGLLEIEIGGAASSDGTVEYDQLQVVGSDKKNVLLDGDLALAWSGAGWSSPCDRLWILRNDTDGTLTGTFHGYANGAVVGDYDGRSWRIYYGVDLDELTGSLITGNDVLLTSASIPEPSSLLLGFAGLLTMQLVYWRRLVGLWRREGA
jgi:autotransporter-associated beta strand protein